MNSTTTIRADFDIRDFGAREEIAPATNRAAINRAIEAASAAGGARVVVPPGEWRTGTIGQAGTKRLYRATAQKQPNPDSGLNNG